MARTTSAGSVNALFGSAVPKAFVEMSVVERLAEHTVVKQYKYCKMLIQEFHVKLDQGFIAALMDVFSVDKLNRNTVRGGNDVSTFRTLN